MKPSPPRCAVQSLVSDDAIFISKPIDRPHGTAAMLVIPPTIGVILILIGIALFIADLHVISHGLLTAGGIVTLLAGGFALLGAGVPYSGLLLGALVVVDSSGGIFVHGERWRAVLAYAPEGTDARDSESMIGVGRKVTVVGFGKVGTVQVIPVQRDYHSRSVNVNG